MPEDNFAIKLRQLLIVIQPCNNDKMNIDGKSLDLVQDNLAKLKQLFPNLVKEGEIDLNEFKVAFGQDPTIIEERYSLGWAGKYDAFKQVQAQTTHTLNPDRDNSIAFDQTENIFIEGENLDVLKILQKSYYGKIKMIYLDPPYNTGNDHFIYPDRYAESKEDYLQRTGEKDRNGDLNKADLFRKNTRENGHFHSVWLSMMYPRLYLARNLLREDGVIFVSIDDNEVANLRLLMDQVFGEENFVAIFPWKKRTAKSDVPFGISQDYEWILCYARTKFGAGLEYERKYYQSDDFPNDRWRLSDLTTQRGAEERLNSAFDMIDPKTGKSYPFNPQRVWGVSKDTFQQYYDKGKIVFPDDYDFLNITIPAYRVFEREDKAKSLEKYGTEKAMKTASTHLPKNVGLNEDGNKEIVKLFHSKMFSFPKPTSLIKHLLRIINGRDSIVLDFFAGSATTAHAVLDLNQEDGGNRKFLCVQLPEETPAGSPARKAGYKTIADIGRARIRKVIEQQNAEQAAQLPLEKRPILGFRSFKLSSSNFKIWRGDVNLEGELLTQLDLFQHPAETDDDEAMLWELLLKAGYPLSATVETKVVNDSLLYFINDGELVIALQSINQIVVNAVRQAKPHAFICLDALFNDDDQLKTNTGLQLQDDGIIFKVI